MTARVPHRIYLRNVMYYIFLGASNSCSTFFAREIRRDAMHITSLDTPTVQTFSYRSARMASCVASHARVPLYSESREYPRGNVAHPISACMHRPTDT